VPAIGKCEGSELAEPATATGDQDIGHAADRTTVAAVGIEEWTSAGLYDPSDASAEERAELLAWMEGRGITLQQMIAACADGQLNALAGDLALRPGRRMTVGDVASAVGIDVDTIDALRRAIGFPPAAADEPVHTEFDLPMFELFAQANTFFSLDELLHFTRVIGSSMRRIAEAAGEMFLRDVEAEWIDEGTVTELQRAQSSLSAIELARTAPGVFEPMFRGHLELATRNTRLARSGNEDYSSVTMAVGFVDLSGFTSRSASLSSDDLLRFIVEFEGAAQDLVNANDGRVIKLIGDEVMFSAVDPDAACRIALGLIDGLDADTGITARGGVAIGPMITAGGDLYGETVNLAARIADIAIAGEVLVNAAVRERAQGFAFEPAGRRQLKGFAAPVAVWSLRR
jgi:adenylate cyclase